MRRSLIKFLFCTKRCSEDSQFIRLKGVKKLVSEELQFSGYEKCVFGSINVHITKEQVSFRSIKHAIYTITNNKTTLRKFSHKEIVNENEITISLLGSNIPFAKHFDDKDIPNYTGKLKKLHQKFTENGQL